eukprot:UN07965
MHSIMDTTISSRKRQVKQIKETQKIKRLKEEESKQGTPYRVNLGYDDAASSECWLGFGKNSVLHMFCSNEKNKALEPLLDVQMNTNSKMPGYCVKKYGLNSNKQCCINEAEYLFIPIQNFQDIISSVPLLTDGYPTPEMYNMLELYFGDALILRFFLSFQRFQQCKL